MSKPTSPLPYAMMCDVEDHLLDLQRTLSTLVVVLTARANAGDLGLDQEVSAAAWQHFADLADESLDHVKELAAVLVSGGTKPTEHESVTVQ